MVTLLITSFILLSLVGIGIYLWQKPSIKETQNLLPPQSQPRGLFSSEDSSAHANLRAEEQIKQGELQAQILIESARNGEKSALSEALKTGDRNLYDRILNSLVEQANSHPKLLSLMSYIARHELPVNRNLARAVLEWWEESPDRDSTAKALHFAALSDDVTMYQKAVETALQLWREAKLSDVSAVELRALFDGEFWVLSSRSRASGGGFLLKRTLANARREMEAAAQEQ
jgi:hypothetical protein